MRTLRCVALACLAAALASPALGAAAIPPEDPGQERIRRSFQDFAAQWMRTLEADARALAGPGRGSAGLPNGSYRSIGKDFQTELRPTGSAVAPYVGILRYSELVHHCADGRAAACGVQRRQTITEIFRYQNGRWVY